MRDPYNIEPRPVTYKGIDFRSKLEATWAVFFDSCRWEYEYEPETFDCWAPDFVLMGKQGRRVYVEVKPVTSLDEPVAQDAMDKMGKALPDRHSEIMLLGVQPNRERLLSVKPNRKGQDRVGTIGWLRDSRGIWVSAVFAYAKLDRFSQLRAAFDGHSVNAKPYDFVAHGDNLCRIHNVTYTGKLQVGSRKLVDRLWGEAKNRVQFMPPAGEASIKRVEELERENAQLRARASLASRWWRLVLRK